MSDTMSLYKFFYTVAYTGNISAAAKLLYTSQPVVSKYINRLEDDLGTQLFIRTSRGVRLTEEGQVLYQYVKSAFASLETGINKLKKIRALGIGHIRIGVSTTLCKYLLLPYLKKYISENPHVKISIQCQSTNQTLELLEQNKIDLGLIGQPDNSKGVEFYKILEIEDIFVASNSYLNNLKIRESQNKLDIFNFATVMLLDKENMTRQYIDDYLKQNHIKPNNLLEISTMDLIIEFSKIGIGIGCVIKEFVENELKTGTLINIPLGIPIHKRNVGFAIQRQSYIAEPVKKFLDMKL